MKILASANFALPFQVRALASDRLQSVFRRRLLTGVGAASLIAIGANFGGVTSFLLGFSPEAARGLKLDAVYPVGGFSRYIDAGEGFEFLYPESWLGDQALLYRSAGKAERSLDLPPLSGGIVTRKINEPVVAFGPPASTGEVNVSVIVSPVSSDFSMESSGGEAIVGMAVAGRGKGTLKAWNLRVDRNGVKYYELEFVVETPAFRRHNVAVWCTRKGKLFTLNAQGLLAKHPHVGDEIADADAMEAGILREVSAMRRLQQHTGNLKLHEVLAIENMARTACFMLLKQ